MKASMKKKRGVVGAVVLAGILSVGGFALTNTITFAQKTVAGHGEQALEVVNVTGTSWTLNTTDPTTVDSVTFTFDSITFGPGGAAAYVKVNDAGAWKACTDIATGAQTTVTCGSAGTPLAYNVKDIGANPAGTYADGSNSTAGTVDNLTLVVAEK